MASHPPTHPRRPEPAPPESLETETPPAADDDGCEALVLTRAAVREVDRLAAEEFGLPSIVLMENAAIHCADVALDLLAQRPAGRALVVCGPGNNGGDGFAIARHLANQGTEAVIVLGGPREKYTGDAATNLGVAERMGIPIEPFDASGGSVRAWSQRHGRPALVIDALLGTGLERPVREPIATLIASINELGRSRVAVLAVDLPSGLDCDTGEPLGDAVRATVTVTFVGLKRGFLALAAQPHVGDVVVADIGVPRALVERLGTPLREALPHDDPPRPPHRPGPARSRAGG